MDYIPETVKVFFGLGLVQIFNVDEKSQVITLKVWEHFVNNISHTLKRHRYWDIKRSCGKVMFSVVSFCHSVHREVPMWPFLTPHDVQLTNAINPHPTPQPYRDPHLDMFKLVNYVSRTVAKWAAGIWLKYLLVIKVHLHWAKAKFFFDLYWFLYEQHVQFCTIHSGSNVAFAFAFAQCTRSFKIKRHCS